MARKVPAPIKGKTPKQGGARSPAAHAGGLTGVVRAHPVRWAVIGYLLLTIIFFSSAIFFPGRMVYGTDSMSAGVFFRTFYSDFISTHVRVPLWDPYIHAGLPFVDAMHGDIFYPAALLQLIFPVTYALGLKLILHVFLAGVFMFLFLRRIGRTDVAAFVGGALYMFSPCLVSLFYPGHDGKLYVMALTPLAFLALHTGVTSRRLGSFLGFGLAYMLMILTAHVQMAFYASWGLGLYFVFLLWKEHRLRPGRIAMPVVAFVLAVALSVGASAIQWLAPYQYLGKHSQRTQYTEGRGGYEWASSWSMNSEELLSVINPEFPGENVQGRPQTYWGQNFFKLNSEAVGVVTFALALVAIVAVPSPVVWFFGGLSILALLHALGDSTPVFRLFFHLVPMVQKFRAPSMINFLFAFSWVVMGAHALDALLDDRAKTPGARRRPDGLRVLAIITGVYGLATLVALVMGSSLLTTWASLVDNPLSGNKAVAVQANAASVAGGFLIGALAVGILTAVIHFRRKGAFGPGAMTFGLVAVSVLPLWQFDSRFVQTVDPRPYYGERPILQAIRRHAPDQPYRVLTLPNTIEDNYLALHGIEEISPSAMHGNHLLIHDNFVGRHDPQPALLSAPVTMDLLNVVFVVSPQPFSDQGFEVLEQNQGLYLLRNTDAMPRAAVFYEYEVNSDSMATLAQIRSPQFPFRGRLILDQPLAGLSPSTGDNAAVNATPARIVEWDVDRFVVEYEAARDGILWLSENYYPAWEAMDESGESIPIYRANYTFRAVPVRAGKGRITFEFHSSIFRTSAWLSLVCLLILLGGWGASLVRNPQPRSP